jgi:uncharacterized membrane protein
MFESLQKHHLFLRFYALATTRSFRLRPILITAITMVASAGTVVIWRTNDWSILRASIGILLR